MNDEEKAVIRHFSELAERSFQNGIYTSTEFLTISEQDLIKSSIHHIPYRFCGGYPEAEKALAFFGSEEICGYEAQPPITFLKIAPVNPKFSDPLSHRDFLGALMSLGIRRSVLGDILVKNGVAYTVCLDNMATFIRENLVSVRHTTVSCERIDTFPEDIFPEPTESSFVVASERLDSVLSAIYKLSRSESKNLIDHEKVRVNGSIILHSDYHPNSGDIITTHSKGKFLYIGMEQETKKGKLRCKAKIYK